MSTGCSHDSMSATAMPLRASQLQAPPGCLSLPRSTGRWPPPDGFEPQTDVALRPSAHYLGEKLFKKLFRFRKTSPFFGTILSRHVRNAPLETTDMEKHPDSDEVVSFCSDTPKSSLSSRSSSSSIESLAIPPPTPPKVPVMAGSQMMASMLLSLLDDDDDDDNEEDVNDESEDDEKFSGGPRVSAWHQPEYEVLTEQDWRMLRYGIKSSAATVVSQTVRNTDAADYVSYKYLARGANHHKPVLNTVQVGPRVKLHTLIHRNTVTTLDCLWVRGELPHLLASVLEVFQFNAAQLEDEI